ncbi:PHF14 [Bugula neritina]|uniref:PHF14 n=1 Tax=Bugula neritina TaxID=10212 RepID=A0A7J7JU72_BUGNE|nr:PHF14 [Bugula neritina]
MEKKESDNEKEDKEHAAVDEESKPSEELDAAQKNDNSSADVAFLYKTMLQRDPSKRRVKPVEKHLMQIHFGMSDDDDTDSDYEFKPDTAADSEDDFGSDENDTTTSNSKVSAQDKNKISVQDADSPDQWESEEDSLSETNSLDMQKAELTISSSGLRSEMKACCVCLSSSWKGNATASCGEDEIIECDGCGILVHEGCYGTVEEDVLSVHSDMSTESTEPWFCDPCKAGVVPSCELCPNQFGIFKQTDTGRWVHLICALYVPAVAFGNTEKLTNVTLLEMPYSKWGSKECSLCEDENYSFTGVCIGCDAGMCRSFFHVTCAQRHGLLSEASIDEEIADPFYAHCKMHGDKLVSKQKKRNFLALHGHVKLFRENKGNRPVSRTKRRLEHFKKKFKEAEARRPDAWAPPNKLPRAITSSASAVSSLLRKAELLGVISNVKNNQSKPQVITKKSFVAPALSVEFAAYHEQRTQKIESLKKLNRESLKHNQKLQHQEKKLELRIDQLRRSIKELQTSYEEQRQAGYEMFKALEGISDKKFSIPEKYKQTEKLKSPTAMLVGKGRQTNYPCGICDSVKEQHLLAKCDQCSKHYHLGCLDPPLARMPKKSKLCGWVCSICDHNNHLTPAVTEFPIDMEAPRSLRQSIKEPDKFVQPELKLFVEKFRRQRVSKAKKRSAASKKKLAAGKPKKAKLTEAAAKVTADPTVQEECGTGISGIYSSPVRVGRKSKVLKTGVCNSCKGDCNGGTAVKCDACLNWHHFACLDPPVKKSPKPRGYQWFCDECEVKEEETVDPQPNKPDSEDTPTSVVTVENKEGQTTKNGNH